MLGALLMAVPLRSNVPVAMFVTFYTNPLTIVPLYLIAYAYGKAILGYHGPDAYITPFEWDWSVSAFWQWMLSLGKPLGIGLVALALTLAVLGYFITELAWRVYIIKAWRRRAARRRSGEGRAPP
jgi:hypothetical protein